MEIVSSRRCEFDREDWKIALLARFAVRDRGGQQRFLTWNRCGKWRRARGTIARCDSSPKDSPTGIDVTSQAVGHEFLRADERGSAVAWINAHQRCQKSSARLAAVRTTVVRGSVVSITTTRGPGQGTTAALGLYGYVPPLGAVDGVSRSLNAHGAASATLYDRVLSNWASPNRVLPSNRTIKSIAGTLRTPAGYSTW